MQRIVAKTVYLVHLALVDTVRPVDCKNASDEGGNLVHLVAVESNHTDAQDIRQVRERVVLARLTFQFSSKAIFCLDAALYRVDVDLVFFDAFAENPLDDAQQLFEKDSLLAVFLQDKRFLGRQAVVLVDYLFHVVSISQRPCRLFLQIRRMRMFP